MRSLAPISGVPPRIIQRINNFRVFEELLLSGVGIALLPRYAPTVRELIRKPVDGINVARRIDAIIHTGTAQRPAIDILTRIAGRPSH